MSTDLCDLYSYILQGCFTGTGASYDCPSASEVTLKNMSEIALQHTTIKQNKSW